MHSRELSCMDDKNTVKNIFVNYSTQNYLILIKVVQRQNGWMKSKMTQLKTATSCKNLSSDDRTVLCFAFLEFSQAFHGCQLLVLYFAQNLLYLHLMISIYLSWFSRAATGRTTSSSRKLKNFPGHFQPFPRRVNLGLYLGQFNYFPGFSNRFLNPVSFFIWLKKPIKDQSKKRGKNN